MQELLSNVSITIYEDDRGCMRDIWIEAPENKDICEYKTVIDNPPDSNEREILSISYMDPSEYEDGINRLVQTDRCDIPCYNDMGFTQRQGSMTLEKRKNRFYCDNNNTNFKLDDLVGKYVPERGIYYGNIGQEVMKDA